jgi:hypothetical protein
MALLLHNWAAARNWQPHCSNRCLKWRFAKVTANLLRPMLVLSRLRLDRWVLAVHRTGALCHPTPRLVSPSLHVDLKYVDSQAVLGQDLRVEATLARLVPWTQPEGGCPGSSVGGPTEAPQLHKGQGRRSHAEASLRLVDAVLRPRSFRLALVMPHFSEFGFLNAVDAVPPLCFLALASLRMQHATK